MTASLPPTSVICPSCGAKRTGKYCASCGEKFLEPRDLSLGHFLSETLPHELFEVEGTVPRTLRLLFTQPGALAREYVSGRRRPYLSPLRAYVLAFVLYVTAGFLSDDQRQPLPALLRAIDVTGHLTHWTEARRGVDWNSALVQAHLHTRVHWLAEVGNVAIFLVVALPLMAVFYRLHRRYLEHTALALSVGTFFIASIALIRLLAAFSHTPGLEVQLQTLASITLLPVYWFLAIRRFYGISSTASLIGASVITICHILIALVINYLVIALLILTA